MSATSRSVILSGTSLLRTTGLATCPRLRRQYGTGRFGPLTAKKLAVGWLAPPFVRREVILDVPLLNWRRPKALTRTSPQRSLEHQRGRTLCLPLSPSYRLVLRARYL